MAQTINAIERLSGRNIVEVEQRVIGDIISSFFANVGDIQVLMGVGAFVATAIPLRNWTREAASDGEVTTNEVLGIGARATMMAAGTYMFEGAMLHDPVSALSAAALLGVELKLGYDIWETLRSGQLNPVKDKNLVKKDYWIEVLKIAGKALGALVIIPKLNLLLIVANPMDTVAGELGAGLIMAANYDQVEKLLNN